MKKVKGFGYDDIKHDHIIKHIDNQPNRSQYIWSLVEKDMKSSSIEEFIRHNIQEYIKEIKLKTIDKSVLLDTDEVTYISNLKKGISTPSSLK